MPNQIIDLRQSTRVKAAESDYHPREIVPTSIEWTAYEYRPKEHGQVWFLTLGAVTLFLVILGFVIRNYFFVVFIVLAYAVIILYTKRGPQKFSAALAKEGVRFGKMLYKFSDLKSFWIFNYGDQAELSLETTKTISQFIRLPLGSIRAETVRNFMIKYLPEEEHQELITDKITRGLGF
ncbi:MAG: hypothetical protein HYW89_01555 [Candidatus Sungiibacteriota bacterium]|uniref:DUF5673 domain-containing protein n=1 Tax=Candidatus Sungiibacteriota bacterium TaxID=2750080 RepID=A0A7T5RK12_9BACT|nr:MAG: hypothetical protein HYW89_01555 [Candidatus Sungbacteria bacterium]